MCLRSVCKTLSHFLLCLRDNLACLRNEPFSIEFRTCGNWLNGLTHWRLGNPSIYAKFAKKTSPAAPVPGSSTNTTTAGNASWNTRSARIAEIRWPPVSAISPRQPSGIFWRPASIGVRLFSTGSITTSRSRDLIIVWRVGCGANSWKDSPFQPNSVVMDP